MGEDSKTHHTGSVHPALGEMMGRRGCMGLAKRDGAGYCVTWWRELSKSRKSRDLRAFNFRPKKKRKGLAI